MPLIELRTVNRIRCVTDNAGWIAFNEPGLMGREVYFFVEGPGYGVAPDAVGYRGVRLTPKAGTTATVKVRRTNIAERIGRLTGQGLYRDSELLGLPYPLPNLNPAGVMGQDTVQAVVYQGRRFWLWGDTDVASYPLGNFRTTCATSAIDEDPENGLTFHYFMDQREPNRLRPMMPLGPGGPVWLYGLLAVSKNGKDVMFAHYGQFENLRPLPAHGIAEFNDKTGVFEKALDLNGREEPNSWRCPRNHSNPLRATSAEGDFFYFATPFADARVKAAYNDILTPASYEALRFDEKNRVWNWQKKEPPTTQREEAALLREGKISATQARYALREAATGKPVFLCWGSIAWNAFRQRFLLIGLQHGRGDDPSRMGEVWYAESDSPTGPWRETVKIASHPDYSLYNVRHHSFLDAKGGRLIYFEGTYTHAFSGNPATTPRYEYNQVMYKLDISDPRLSPAQQPSEKGGRQQLLPRT